MSQPTEIVHLALGGYSEVSPTVQFRWVGKKHTTTAPYRLQQAWRVVRHDDHGRPIESKIEWRDLPLHLED